MAMPNNGLLWDPEAIEWNLTSTMNSASGSNSGGIYILLFFIYRDRSTLNSIEEIAVFMADLIDEQSKGNLPYDLLFVLYQYLTHLQFVYYWLIIQH